MYDGWKYRRRFLFITSGFYMGIIVYILIRWINDELARSAITSAFLALSGNGGMYVFGSSWESIGMAKQGLTKGDYQPQPTNSNQPQPPQGN